MSSLKRWFEVSFRDPLRWIPLPIVAGKNVARNVAMIERSVIFDHVYYANITGKSFGSRRQAVLDYLANAGQSPAAPHPLFDSAGYLSRNADVAAHGVNPLLHFLEFGGIEGRNPCADFDIGWYLANYPDVAASRMNPLEHYLLFGAAEGRNPSSRFDSRYYLESNPDVAAAGLNPLAHYVANGRAEGRAPRAKLIFRLDDNFRLSSGDFGAWREERISRYLGSHADDYIKPDLTDFSAVSVLLDFAMPTDGRPRNTLRQALERVTPAIPVVTGPALAEAIAGLSSEYLLFLGSDDQIDEPGLQCIARATEDGADLVVFDSFCEEEQRYLPILQPGANILHFRAVDAVFSRFMIRRELAQRLLKAGAPASARDLLLLALADGALSGESAMMHAAVPAFETSINLEVVRASQTSQVSSFFREPAAPSFLKHRSVTVIICTKDKGYLLNGLLTALARDYERWLDRIVIVSNNTSHPHALQNLAEWKAHPLVEVVEYKPNFNFSDQTNIGVQKGKGEFVLLLNDDIIPLSKGWLFALLSHFTDPMVGAAGPLLLYPNETAQHAGMHMGCRGSAGHSMKGASLPLGSYLFHGTHAREVTCVTGAVLLMRRDMYENLNGLDIQLATIFQDVDLCLRINNLGYRIIFEPGSVLMHMESVSINTMLASPAVQAARGREHQYFVKRHGEQRIQSDRWLNPAFDPEDETLRTVR